MTIIQKPSPNQDSNRVKIDRVVIHWIVGNLAAADSVFAKAGNASAHYGVENNIVHQYVAENKVAYHAGQYSMNQRSIGIEHSAAPDRLASEETYQTSGQLIREICQRHGIPIDRAHIIKHSEVIATQCPGTMNLDKLISIAKGQVTSSPTNMDQKKAEQLDKIKDYLKSKGFNISDDPNSYVPIILTKVQALWEDRENQKGRAGKWDLIVNKAFGQPTPSENISVDTVAAKLGGAVDIAKIKEEGRQLGIKQVKDVVAKVV